MKKVVCTMVVLALLTLAVAAVAAPGKPGRGERAALPALTGVVKSVVKDGNMLKSFVLTTPAVGDKPATDLTISVTDKTKYFKNRETATSASVVVGAKVVVRTKTAVKDKAATATAVRLVERVKHPKSGAK
ncbi:MAG: hypothetical protein ABFE16_13680 [Armatimonadia bacterium]